MHVRVCIYIYMCVCVCLMLWWRRADNPEDSNAVVDKASKVIDVLEDPRASLARKQSQAESLESVTKGVFPS